MPRPERIRGTVVHLLDPEKTTEFLQNKLNNSEITHDPMVVANGNKGIATVCSEGVGWFVDDNGLLPVNYHVGQFGSGYVDITPEELMPLISDETIDLADFIRSFGDRLENNFYSWVNYTRNHDQSMSVATATIR
jgi:hypothetical protein